MEQKNIIIVGVGGQGTLLASRILGGATGKLSYDVKLSEVHGMSQRGGSVVTYVKYGEKIYSPIVDKGDADIILAFEPLEAYRALPYLKKGGEIIVNNQKTDPMPVITGAMEYPADIMEKMKEVANVTQVDALKYALEAGNERSVNVVLIGVLAGKTNIPREIWTETIKETVPPKFIDSNLKAFDLGFGIGTGLLGDND